MKINSEKQLKRQEFNLLDSAYMCALFLALQLIVDFLVSSIKSLGVPSAVVYILAFISEFAFLIPIIVVAKTRNINFFKATKLKAKIDVWSVLIAVAISLVCLFTLSSLTDVFIEFIEKLGYSSDMVGYNLDSFGKYLIFVFLIAICPAFFEDLLFRGAICSGLESQGRLKAVLLSSLLFSLMHGSPDQTIHQFILGIILAYSLIYSGSVVIPMIIHFVNNFIALTSMYVLGVSENNKVLSWGELGIKALIALIYTIIGVVVVYFLIKALGKLKENRDKKELLKVEKKEQDESEVIEEKTSLTETMQKANKEKSDKSVATTLLIISIAYLSINWLLTLILGFM